MKSSLYGYSTIVLYEYCEILVIWVLLNRRCTGTMKSSFYGYCKIVVIRVPWNRRIRLLYNRSYTSAVKSSLISVRIHFHGWMLDETPDLSSIHYDKICSVSSLFQSTIHEKCHHKIVYKVNSHHLRHVHEIKMNFVLFGFVSFIWDFVTCNVIQTQKYANQVI
jgi:hypothetical protein